MVIIGDKSVGKTSIVKRYIDKSFSMMTESTIGASYFASIVNVQPLGSLEKV